VKNGVAASYKLIAVKNIREIPDAGFELRKYSCSVTVIHLR